MAIFWPGSFIFGFPGVMATIWAQDFQVGRGAIGATLFFTLAAVGLLMFFVGKWQERLGPHNMITIGALLTGLDVLFLVFVNSLEELYLWAFIMGGASCFIYIPGLTVVQKAFPERRGLVSGVFNMTFGLSAAIMAPLFSLGLVTLGYERSCALWSVAALITGIAASRLTRPPVEDLGVQDSAPQKSAAPSFPMARHLTLSDAVRTRNFWFLWTVWALQGAAGISMVTLATPFALSKGLSLYAGVAALTVFNITNGASRLVSGILSDRFGRTGIMSLSAFLAGLSYLALGHVGAPVIIALLAAIIGYAFGTLFSVSAPLATDCFGILHFGAIFGLIFTAYGFVAAPLGPALTGFALDHTNNDFTLVFSYLAAFCLISSILIRFVGPTR